MATAVRERLPEKTSMRSRSDCNATTQAIRFFWEQGQWPFELSIIVPVYNGSATVGRVLEEMFHELADKHVEMILVNDGSSDQTFDVCVTLVERHPGPYIALHHPQWKRNTR